MWIIQYSHNKKDWYLFAHIFVTLVSAQEECNRLIESKHGITYRIRQCTFNDEPSESYYALQSKTDKRDWQLYTTKLDNHISVTRRCMYRFSKIAFEEDRNIEYRILECKPLNIVFPDDAIL